MVTLNKIYTKTGDDGETALGNGDRVEKFSIRVKTYGSVDELNSHIGIAVQHSSPHLKKELELIQNDLFDLGADFCNPFSEEKRSNKGSELRISDSQVKWIEKRIDSINSTLGALKSFILPGGSLAASHLHVCRTVCRRAERYAVELASTEKINSESLKYLNRLSDWFFVAARFENNNGKDDKLWVPGANLQDNNKRKS